jgi:hypothetical protein
MSRSQQGACELDDTPAGAARNTVSTEGAVRGPDDEAGTAAEEDFTMAGSNNQVLLLRDGDGAQYAIPVHVVRTYRVPDELRRALLTAVEGGAEVQGYGGPFEIVDYSFDIEQTLNSCSQSSGAGAGKASFNEFKITKPVDASSPIFFR